MGEVGVACLGGQTPTHAMVPARTASLWQSWWGWGGFGRGCAEEMRTSLLLVPVQSCRCSCPSPVVKRQRENNPSPRRCCRTSTYDGISRKLWGRAEMGGEGVASAGQKQSLWFKWDLRGAKTGKPWQHLQQHPGTGAV